MYRLFDKAMEIEDKASNLNLRKAFREGCDIEESKYLAVSHLMMLDFRNAARYFNMANLELKPLEHVALWHGSDPEIISMLGIGPEPYDKYLKEKALANISMYRQGDEFFLDENKLNFILDELSERGVDPVSALEETIQEMEEAGKRNTPKKLLLAKKTGDAQLIRKYQDDFDSKMQGNRKRIDQMVQEYCAFDGIRYIRRIQAGDKDNFFPVASSIYLIEKDGQKEVIKENLRLYTDFSSFSGYNHEKEIYEKISHPNIIGYNGTMSIDGIEFLRFGYFEGDELSAYTRKGNLLDTDETCRLMMKHAEVLDHLHSEGIMYMDVKDKNVLYDGEMRLLDFGMAQMQDEPVTRKTIKRSLLSTPAYIAPEWGIGFNVTNTTETFQLGILFHQLLTGEHPFATHDFEDGDRESEVIKYGLPNIFNDYLPPEAEPRICSLLKHMLNKDPLQRPTPGEVAETIGGWYA